MQNGNRISLFALCLILGACEWAPQPGSVVPAAASAATVAPAADTPLASPAEAKATRPSYNNGKGFFVSGGKLFDGKGNEFRMRGVNRNHYDSASQPGLSRAGANTVRIFLGLSISPSTSLQILQSQHLANKEVAVPTLPEFPGGKLSACNNDVHGFTTGVDWWVDNAKLFAQVESATIINIANEWGPGSSVLWRDAYIVAVKKMRVAGYRAPLMIDSGGCGQDINDLVNYAAEIFEADPQKNLIFSFHVYGNTPTADIPAVFAKFGDMQKNSGMVFVIGEFGPGRNIGPSPTMTTPEQVITAAEANDLGWLAWAWDDNNKDGGESDNNWFSLTLHGPGVYEKPSDLTEFGKLLVLDPRYSFRALAKRATIF